MDKTRDHKTVKSTIENAPDLRLKKRPKAKLICRIILLVILLGLGGAIVFIIIASNRGWEGFDFTRVDFPDPVYSVLTGEEISDEKLNSSPTFCVQIPNGVDGARPQAGLTHAGVVFEAIAEAGITRFAAIFQNAETSVIGPIRSLRPYYLEWDTPFDCTIVHAGGSYEALQALKAGNYRDLTENYSYMWREENSHSGRLWNNLFTSPSDMMKFNNDRGYTSSAVTSLARTTPDEVTQLLVARSACAESAANPEEGTEPCAPETLTTQIELNIGNIPTFNVVYKYNAETNSYDRSYANGSTHMVYDCPANLNMPDTTTECGAKVQLSPKVVVALIVKEGKMSDNYHEKIQTTGSGKAYIFQNGLAIEGTWHKDSAKDQLNFTDTEGNEIKLAPGQTWFTAVPQYGSVNYQ